MRYRSSDGAHLVIDEQYDGFHIVWHFPGEASHGAYVGERRVIVSQTDTPDMQRDAWEVNTAHDAAEPFSSGNDTSYGFRFETEKEARFALRAANTALSVGAEMPEWAVKAIAAGWKPPKGWRP